MKILAFLVGFVVIWRAETIRVSWYKEKWVLSMQTRASG